MSGKKNKIKVLYVGYILQGDPGATGNTLHNIYSNCKNVQILQYCLDYDSAFHTTQLNTVYLSRHRSAVFSILKDIYRKKNRTIENNRGESVSSHQQNAVVDIAKGIFDVLYKKESKESLKNIDEFRPDIILCLAENISTLKSALYFSKRYNAPIVVHVMDDIEKNIYKSKFTCIFRWQYLRLLRKTYNRSLEGIAISPKMAEEYQKRHGIPFAFAMNCIKKVYNSEAPNNMPLRVYFSGGLHGGRAEQLAHIGSILSKKFEKTIELVIFTSKANIKQYKKMLEPYYKVYEYVPQNKMFENLAKADILLHCESFNPEEIQYFKYSMSTKIPEYLSVGRPILCYGPKEVCTVSYLKDNKVGVVAENEQELVSAIVQLQNNEIRKNFGKNALKVAREEYLAEKVASRVEEVFQNNITL